MKSQFWILCYRFLFKWKKPLQKCPILQCFSGFWELRWLNNLICAILARQWPYFTAVVWPTFVFLYFVFLAFLVRQMFCLALPDFSCFSVIVWPVPVLLYIVIPLKIISLSHNSLRNPAFTSTEAYFNIKFEKKSLKMWTSECEKTENKKKKVFCKMS